MSQVTPYDLIVLGGGPGGYVAAERAGAAGLKVLLIEESHLGGVCLNAGCVPSKTLLYSAKLYAQAKHLGDFGVSVGEPSFDLTKVMARKDKIIQNLRQGVAFQMQRNKVTVVNGRGRLAGHGKVTVGEQVYQGRHIILATGSAPVRPPIPGADLPHVLDSTGILRITALPKQLVIIGGGVIGMEFASFFSSVGVAVTVVELLPEILPLMDAELAVMLRKTMKGVQFMLGAKVTAISAEAVQVEAKGQVSSVPADTVLMCVGRAPNTRDLGLETLGVEHDRRGIKVNERCETNVPGVFAVGDVNGRCPLAHAASRMGEVAVQTILGHRDQVRYHALPWVVYTYPELAGVGLTEAEAKQRGIAVRVAKWQMRANGRFLAEHAGSDNGLCKILVGQDNDVILGVHLLGSQCSEMIFGAAAMIETELRGRDLRELVFPHPTVSEVIRDAVWELAHH